MSSCNLSSSLDVAAKRTDRARIGVSHVDELVLGFTLRADAPRAGALRDLGAAGPELYLGAAHRLGGSANFDVFARALTGATVGSHSQTALFERATLNGTVRPGPFGIHLSAVQSGELHIGERQNEGQLRGGMQARLGLPLLRQFGSVAHFVEPNVVARGLVEAEPRGSQLHDSRALLAVGGFDTSLGERRTRQALSLTVRGGALERSSTTNLVGMTRAGADSRFVGLAQAVAFVGQQSPSVISLSRLRLGRADGLHLLARADGASTGSAAQARVLFDESWFDPARPFLDRSGWSAGSELSVPWTRAFTTTASLDYDLTAYGLLAAWGGVGYRHPCGCLAVASFVGHRVGRGGIDAWVGFDLAP